MICSYISHTGKHNNTPKRNLTKITRALSMLAFLIFLGVFLGCSEEPNAPPPVVKSSEKQLTELTLRLEGKSVTGTINESQKTVDFAISYGATISSVAIEKVVVSKLASITTQDEKALKAGSILTFTNSSTTIQVVAEDASTNAYTITLTPAAAQTGRELTEIVLELGDEIVKGTTTANSTTFNFSIPYKSTITSGKISRYAVSQLASLTTSDDTALSRGDTLTFTNTNKSTTIKVVAQDGTANTYTLQLVEKAAQTGKELTKLTLTLDTTDVIGTRNEETKTMEFIVELADPFGTDISAKNITTGTIVEVAVSDKAIAQTTEGQALAKDSTITFTDGAATIQVKAEDDNTQNYTIQLRIKTQDPVVYTYAGENIKVLGLAMDDDSLADNTDVITIERVANADITWNLANRATQTKTAAGNTFSLTKAEVKNEFTGFADKEITLTLQAGGVSYTTTLDYKPLEIYTKEDLQAMRLKLDGNYVQMQNIAFALPLPTVGEGFEPIGRDTDSADSTFQGTKFTGSFNGNGFTIANLYINRRDEYNIGLFGYVDAGATIQNVRIENAYIEGEQNTGGIAGRNDGAVYAAITTSTIDGNGNTIGGLIGFNTGTVYGYSITSTIKYGVANVGGLVGYNGGIAYGYSTSNVTGGKFVGGLIGQNDSTVHGYATGNVSGEESVGGLVGRISSFTTTQGYARGDVIRLTPSTDTSFSRLAAKLGADETIIAGYHSGKAGESELTGLDDVAITGTDGSAVDYANTVTQSAFEEENNALTFGDAVGNFIWIDGNNWPAINLGTYPGTNIEISPQAEQPTGK